MQDSMFRDLDAKEIDDFKQWARENHKAGDQVSPLWHPVVRNECYTMDKEAGLYEVADTADKS